jgi:LPXTG-motif cell wall-anchored protein
MGSLNSNGYAQRTNQKNSAMVFYPIQKTTKTETIQFNGTGYRITNTPLSSETSVKVVKKWDHPTGDTSLYEKEQVTLKLLANGVDTGRTETVNLKNNWTVTFSGLPYYDENGDPLVYTVVETWKNNDWVPVYGEISKIAGTIPTYETIVTNRYRWTEAFELPSTGGGGNIPYILMGLILISAPLVYGLSLRRRYRKEARE